jgi:hypothetical protein
VILLSVGGMHGARGRRLRIIQARAGRSVRHGQRRRASAAGDAHPARARPPGPIEDIVDAVDVGKEHLVASGASIELGDEAAHARLVRGAQQRVGALRAKPVGLREAAVEMLAVAQIRQGGRLIEDRLGLGSEDGLAKARASSRSSAIGSASSAPALGAAG